MTSSNRSGALVPSEDRPTFDLADLALIEADVAAETEVDADLARGDRELAKLGFTEEEIARVRGRQPGGDAPRSAVPTRTAIEKELAELADLRKTNRSKYWSAEVQAREARLYELRLQLDSAKAPPVEITVDGDVAGIPQAVLDEWEASADGVEAHMAHARKTVKAMLDELDTEERDRLVTSFDEELPEAARAQVYRFIGFDARGGWRAADAAAVARFSESEEGAALVAEWGKAAAKNVGAIKGQVATILKGLSAADRAKTEAFIDGLSPAQARSVWKALVPTS